MQARAWKGGQGAHPTYGLAISKSDRDALIDSDLGAVWIRLPTEDEPIEIELTQAFWDNCSEFRHPAIRSWFDELGTLDWPKGNPPRFALSSTGPNRFTARRLEYRSLL